MLCAVLLCAALGGQAQATVPQAKDSLLPPQASLMQHPGWQRINALSDELPFAWARRYLELRAIAEDMQIYIHQVPPQLENLAEVTEQAQKNVVTPMLDLVPAQSNVQESSYIVGILQRWHWRLGRPLGTIAPVASALKQYQEVLESIGVAVGELQTTTHKRPVMEKASQDFHDLYIMVSQRVQQTSTDIRTVRQRALTLFGQIENAMLTAEQRFAQQWVDYYLTPRTITSGAFLRMDVDMRTMTTNLSYDENYPESVLFVLGFNALLLCFIVFSRMALRQIAATRTKAFPFLQSFYHTLHSLDRGRKLTLLFCFVAMLNSLVNSLPQIHAGVPFNFVLLMGMAPALALWARSSDGAPVVWQLSLPAIMGLLLLHGDASSMFTLLGMSGALLASLLGLFAQLRGNAAPSPLRGLWAGVLALGLLLTVLGLGRLAIVLCMAVLTMAATLGMFRRMRDSTHLRVHTMARAFFMPALILGLLIMGISFMLGCSGLEFLLNHWQNNPIVFWDSKIYCRDAMLLLISFVGVSTLSHIVGRFLISLTKGRRVLDASALPVLQVVVRCLLWSVFGFVVLYNIGVDVTSLAFIGGGLSVGVGIASKTILGNFFCGLVIIFSRMVRAGDLVEVNNVCGHVVSVNMRATVVETVSSGILLVPNEEMLNSRMTNWTLNNNYVREDVSVRVALESNVEMVVAALRDAAVTCEGILDTPPPKPLFVAFGEQSMDFALQVWVRDVDIREATLSEVRRAVLRVFAERGVVLASPRLEVTLPA